MSAANLLYLATALDKPEYVERAEKCIQSAAPDSRRAPSAVPQLAVALVAWIDMTRRRRKGADKK